MCIEYYVDRTGYFSDVSFHENRKLYVLLTAVTYIILLISADKRYFSLFSIIIDVPQSNNTLY